MILHPDGRVEGTPAEIAQYQQTKQATPMIQPTIPQIVPKPYRDVTAPSWIPGTGAYPWAPIWCGVGNVTNQPGIQTVCMN